MKNVKLILVSLGILAVLLSGCFNPITAIPPKESGLSIDPFTVDILIGKDPGDARGVAGPDAARIKGDIRNIIQLIVVNEAGGIVAFDEVRRGSSTEESAVLRIESIPFNHKYYFLLLMGHWERDYAIEKTRTDGKYVYTANPPTLLAAGLREQTVTGSGKITVSMWPLVVDTVFNTADENVFPSGARKAEAVVNAGKPGTVNLLPVDWEVTWTLKGGIAGNGLTDLIRAQKVIDVNAGDALRLLSKETIVRGTGLDNSVQSHGVETGNVISLPINDFTSGIGRIGASGSVNFKLEYVPFNLAGDEGSNPWNEFVDNSVFDLNGTKAPVWIIRNGVNDEPQNAATDFEELGKVNMLPESANGNGAVSFVIRADTPANPENPQPGDLVIRNGKFMGPADAPGLYNISFTTEGYSGEAEVYYAVVPAGPENQPEYSGYEYLDSVVAGPQQEQIEIPGTDDHDVYVLLMKGGKVSAPVKINTGAGGTEVEGIWGEDPYLIFYVKSDGNNNASGTKDEPLATVQRALQKIKTEYAGAAWPGKGTGKARSAGIFVVDTAPVAQQIDISGEADYPPILLRDDPETPGGILQAEASIGSGKSLLRVSNGVNVTLDGNLILEGTSIPGIYVNGVYAYGSTFTMNDGKISGNSASVNGGGVYVEGSTFTMNGGEISGNSAGANGGGIYVYSGSVFTMNGGKISGNSASGNGGGVTCFYKDSAFTMNGGEISGNSAVLFGGGVYCLTDIMFTMNGGKIWDNSAQYGGGVSAQKTTFTMSGGEILENSANNGNGGGVYCTENSTFTMSGGEVLNNSANNGGGVYCTGNNIFTISGGEILNNSASNGGGVYGAGNSIVTMSGGKILGNSAVVLGGGVYITKAASVFQKTGGIIYGYDSNDENTSNIVKNQAGSILNGKGHAVYGAAGPRYKDTTVGAGDNLSYNPILGEYTGWD